MFHFGFVSPILHTGISILAGRKNDRFCSVDDFTGSNLMPFLGKC
jgi:hypothetical protein